MKNTERIARLIQWMMLANWDALLTAETKQNSWLFPRRYTVVYMTCCVALKICSEVVKMAASIRKHLQHISTHPTEAQIYVRIFPSIHRANCGQIQAAFLFTHPLFPICPCLLCAVIYQSIHLPPVVPTLVYQPTLCCLDSLSANLPSAICLTFSTLISQSVPEEQERPECI